MLRKNIFFCSLLFFHLFYFQLLAESNAFTPVSKTTKATLLESFGIELIDRNSPFWTDKEGQAFIDILNQIPRSIAHSIKQTGQNLKLYKQYRALALSPNGFAIRKSFGHYEVPVYRKKHLLSAAVTKNPDYSAREKEFVTFLFDHNLVAADLSDLDVQKEPSIIQERLKYYIPYLQRELVQLILNFYDEASKASNKEEWLSISDWEYSSFLFMNMPWVTSTSNRFIEGYAHPLGLEGPKDDFISFGASFFVTPVTFYSRSIKCRTPRKYKYFRTLFPNYRPHLENPEFSKRGIQCPNSSDDFTRHRFKDIHTGQSIEIGPISKETVKGFELIYATPGDQEISEIAGHLLLRIKLDNNRQADALGIENPKDLVIAVFANSLEEQLENTKTDSDTTTDKMALCSPMDEEPKLNIDMGIQMALQALKGLAGLYLTTIQVDTFQHVIQQYTVNGNRNLKRYRLILSESEKAMLLEYLYIAVKNQKWRYYFFTENCASLLIKMIGKGLHNSEVDYSPLVIPPNALIAMLQEKNVIEPVYPTIYSFTATAEIAQDLIKDRLLKISQKYPNVESKYWVLNWPEVDDLFSDVNTRADLYRQLYLIAMQNQVVKDDIIYILQMSQKAELYYTWKEGMCFSYSTEAKSVARSALLALEKKYSGIPPVNIAQEIFKRDTPTEILDHQRGTHHTQLMSFRSGIRFQESPVFGSRQALFFGGTIYHQEMGDHSFNAMQRGTYVDFGKVEMDLANDENDYLAGSDWQITALKIRKVKARRHYVPHLKLGLGFTVLELAQQSWLDDNTTLLVAGEVFSSLVSSRLNLDHLNIAIGAGIESPWKQQDAWQDKLYNKNRVFDFLIKMDGLLTFGEDRDVQLRGDVTYHYRLDELGPQDEKNEKLIAQLGFQWQLPEMSQTELLLIGGVSCGNTFRKNKEGDEISQVSAKLGLEMNRW